MEEDSRDQEEAEGSSQVEEEGNRGHREVEEDSRDHLGEDSNRDHQEVEAGSQDREEVDTS